jgi:hypothetical protein
MTDANFVPHATSTPGGRHPGDRPRDPLASGTWTIAQHDYAPVHTFSAPEDGWLATSHMIELPSQLLAVELRVLFR